MYTIKDLFDRRNVVGVKLEQILVENSYTKTWLCKQSGVSRPTLDKLLAGTITNKTNYEKHLSKILNYLQITPDVLMGNIMNCYSKVREARDVMKITTEDILNATGISEERLRQIELGEKTTVAELRDIALCLNMGTDDILGLNYFDTQVATLDYFFEFSKSDAAKKYSGFWGNVGILPTNVEEYQWFPITGHTRQLIYQRMNSEKMVVPCMNNKLLFLNMKNIKNIILLDEACGLPEFANWDPAVSSGEIPKVVYESIEDYFYDKNNQDIFSSLFLDYLDELVEKKGWTEDTIHAITDLTTIYYTDGKKGYTTIDFNQNESLSSEICSVHDFGESLDDDNILFFTDMNEADMLLNLRNVSLLELPLIKVENVIRKSFDD